MISLAISEESYSIGFLDGIFFPQVFPSGATWMSVFYYCWEFCHESISQQRTCYDGEGDSCCAVV